MRPSSQPFRQLAFPALASLAALAALALAAPLARAQPPDTGLAPDSTLETVLQGQPPLTEEELPAAVEILIDLDADGSGYDRIGAKYGLDRNRLIYFANKLTAGMWMLDPDFNAPAEDVAMALGTPLALPSPEELALIGSHYDEIRAAREAARR
ncbi:MAG: hypothetical protein LBR80_18330 [Deltaproteobacteria bacterium]|nr:hypothetical protein [Deltaproteobacteria bacterium]